MAEVLAMNNTATVGGETLTLFSTKQCHTLIEMQSDRSLALWLCNYSLLDKKRCVQWFGLLLKHGGKKINVHFKWQRIKLFGFSNLMTSNTKYRKKSFSISTKTRYSSKTFLWLDIWHICSCHSHGFICYHLHSAVLCGYVFLVFSYYQLYVGLNLPSSMNMVKDILLHSAV